MCVCVCVSEGGGELGFFVFEVLERGQVRALAILPE